MLAYILFVFLHWADLHVFIVSLLRRVIDCLLIKAHYKSREGKGRCMKFRSCLYVFLAKCRKLIMEKNHDGIGKTQITLYAANFYHRVTGSIAHF